MHSPAADHPKQDSALRIVVLYAAFASLWILGSDALVVWMFTDVQALALASTAKGWLFVAVTSALLFVLIHRLIAQYEDALQTVQQRESELLQNSQLLLQAQQLAGLGSYELDVASGTWTSSEVCNQVMGIDASFTRDMASWRSLVHPADWDSLWDYFSTEVLQGARSFSREYRIVRPKDGGERWIRALGQVDLDDAGKPARLHGTFQDITDHRMAQAKVAEANSTLQATLDALPDLLFEVGKDGLIHQYHSHRSDLLAAPPEVFLGRRFNELLPPAASAICEAAIQEAEQKGHSSGMRYALDLPQGTHWFELSVAPMQHTTRDAQRYIFISRDVTDRVQAEKQLELSGLVFAHAREGIMVTDASGKLVDVNTAFTRITGYTREEVLGQNPRFLNSGRQGQEFYTALWLSVRELGFWSGEIWNRRKDGEVYPQLLTISTVRNEAGLISQYVALFSDITAQKQYQSELEHIAHFDVLTGLPNRLLLADRLQQAMAQSDRRGQKVLIAYLDLDDFKQVNDQYGHAMGDQLLIALGQRLKDHLREGDTLARLGGDEFVAVLTDFSDVNAALPIISRLIESASAHFDLQGTQIQISTSIGLTSYPQESHLDADQLLRQADQAMYQAKLAGKNRFHLFDTQHDSAVRGHFDILERLRLALARGEFVLHYQPKVNMRSGQVIGVEALIRWQHPERGLLAPGLFLPDLESTALSVDVGEWVMESAMQQHEQWLASGLDIAVSVNVGALQLQRPDFVNRLQALLARHPQLNPARIQFEILETSALQDIKLVIATINACKALGIAFALDDFGTGYSSLTYLQQLPIAVLKIDQSFVRGVLDNPQDQAILRGILGLAQAFGREVIAEGVETEAHGTLLLQLGCEEAQGYGVAKPMAGQAFPQWLHQWRPHPDWLDTSSPTVRARDIASGAPGAQP